MNERLVFFCDRERRPCYFYRWGVIEGGTSYLYQVYCRSALDETLSAQPGQKIDLMVLVRQVAAAGGGLVAETRHTGDHVVVSIQRAPAADFEPAQGMMMLAPGQEPKPVPIDGCSMMLTTGGLALVPATAADEANLTALIKHLERLPGDYRGLVLDVLRQPSIDGAMRRLTLRINELSERLGQASADRSPALDDKGPSGLAIAPRADATGRGRDAATGARIGGFWPWLLTGLLILNLGGLAAGAWHLPGNTAREIQRAAKSPIQNSQSQPTEPTHEIACEAQIGESARPSPSAETMIEAQVKRLDPLADSLKDCESKLEQEAMINATNEEKRKDPKQAINDLIETWMVRAYGWATDDPRRIVAETHFSDRKGAPIYTPGWLTSKDGDSTGAGFKRRERIIYAIAKMMLIQAGISIPKQEETLGEPDARTNIKKAIMTGLSTKGGDPQLNDDDRQLLAWLACSVFPQDKLGGNAQFVKVADEDPETSDGNLELACADIQVDKVLVAIQQYRDALTSTRD